jgi:uncharacterized protein YjbJ (UPF0337 family)
MKNENYEHGSWRNVKKQIQRRWGKLSDDEVDSLHGNIHEVIGLLQKNYGYTRSKAEEEFENFNTSLESVSGEAKEKKTFGVTAILILVGLIVITAIIYRYGFR